ncbi:MAG: carbohydrate binding domain-containing protein [Sedimentisphaerales bacterium]|nr:carbohydrate binding domain-containing protein [Sedimentisphaerales bacterium]
MVNSGFETWRAGTPDGWNSLWTRDKGAGEMAIETEQLHQGTRSVRIEHKGDRDWGLNYQESIPVQPGDLFEYTGWIRREGAGEIILCVTAYDAKGTAIDWSLGGRMARQTGTWEQIQCSFVVSDGVAKIQPRLIGNGPATVWFDEVNMSKTGTIRDLQGKGVPVELTISNPLLKVRLDTSKAVLVVTDKRCDRSWTQYPVHKEIVIIEAASRGNRIAFTALHAPTGQQYSVSLELETDTPEFTLSISSQDNDQFDSLRFPHPFTSSPGDYLVVPMNEGIRYPVDDPTIHPMTLIAYGGHGICMSFWGVADGDAGHMVILETPDDAAIHIGRSDGNLYVAPLWHPQKGTFGYTRRLRYVFFDKGGHVAMCKRYRQYAQQIGRFKALQEKHKENPHVDLLIGAVNVWCWERDPLAIVREMREAGIERILWSRRGSPQDIEQMNTMEGVLTSRYDIYQDLMDPQVVEKYLRGAHSDWTQEGWPKDLMRDERGDWHKGWQVKGRDGNMYPCGVLCDRQALAYAARRVPAELKTHPYRCRFIDTTTASPWRECYDPDHPMTRSDSRHWKMELLRYMSETCKLVTGSETGHDAAVPYVHYFEGMMSLGPYRVPDAGRDMSRILDEVPDRVLKFQVGHQYRLPLWELVYHDCVVAQWYWGDYNNKLPAIWKKRDLFNILYATPPMFMFKRDFWNENKKRFAQSYQDICPVVREVGYSEMTDHRFLTPDCNVQQTRFSNGTCITVNFGDGPYRLSDAVILPSGRFNIARSN